MNLSELNYLAIAIAGLVYFFLGLAWYSKLLFGDLWLKLMKLTPEQIKAGKQKGMAMPMILSLIKALVMALVLAYLVLNLTPFSLVNSLLLTLAIWLAFIVAVNLDKVLWENSPLSLFWLNNFYHLVGFVVITIIVKIW